MLFSLLMLQKTSVEHEIINTVLPEQIAQLVHLLHPDYHVDYQNRKKVFFLKKKKVSSAAYGKKGSFSFIECFQVFYFNQLHCSAWVLKLFLNKNRNSIFSCFN